MLLNYENMKLAIELIFQKPNQIYLFDFDNTLFISNLFIYYKYPNENIWRSFPCSKWKEYSRTLPKDVEYDFREFYIYLEAMKNKKIIPNIEVLKIWDYLIQNGKEIGIWTSRNLTINFNEIYLVLKWRDKNGKLRNIDKNILKKENIIYANLKINKSEKLNKHLRYKYDLFILFDDEIINYEEIKEYLDDEEFIYVDTLNLNLVKDFYKNLKTIL